MGSIVTVAQSKGRAGKTTLVAALGPNLAAAGYRVAVVDSDRNQSFAGWHAQAYEGPALTVTTEIDHVGMADFVLIPCMPDRGSVRETLRTAQQVASLSRAARRPIPHSIVLTRWKAKGLSERAALDSLSEAGLPILAQPLSDLTDYSKLSFSGAVPVSGKVGLQAHSLVAELVANGVIQDKGTSGPSPA